MYFKAPFFLFISAGDTLTIQGKTSVKGRKVTADWMMILIATIIGRLFNSIIDLFSALLGKSEEHCARSIVRGFYLLVHMLSSAVTMYGLGMTSSDCSRLEIQPALAFRKLS